MQAKKPEPIKRPEEIANHPDASIDQDFKGFPFSTATKKMITPETEKEKIAAGIDEEEVKKTSGG
jgi:hypothetical protein